MKLGRAGVNDMADCAGRIHGDVDVGGGAEGSDLVSAVGDDTAGPVGGIAPVAGAADPGAACSRQRQGGEQTYCHEDAEHLREESVHRGSPVRG